MRRIYYTDTPQRRRLKQEAMLAMRQVRGMIDPALLESIRTLTAGVKDIMAEDDGTHVDRRKNLMVVAKFIEMKAANKTLCRQVQAIVSESATTMQ